VKRNPGRAIFIDKDGTLIKDYPYSVDPSKIEFYPEVWEALRLMARRGFLLIVVSNQPGVAKGYFREVELENLISAFRQTFSRQGVPLSGFYYCPHHPQGVVEGYSIACQCRKPNPGLIFRAARQFNVELDKSWMIGDILNDVEAGNRAGCRTIMLDRKHETEWLTGEWRKPDFIVGNFLEAARTVVECAEPFEVDRVIL
jgi:D,D-heptose 1,7-bisphosphate phosphatase